MKRRKKPIRRRRASKRSKQLLPLEQNGFPLARYEAATFQFGDRSWLPAAVQDARFDATESTRLELVRRSRYWARNNAIVQKLKHVFAEFTVGPTGLQAVPSVPDEQDYNQLASEWWSDWCRFPDANSSHSFGVMQRLMCDTRFDDGGVFIYKTFSPESGRPRIQLIEGHRFGTPPHLRTEEGQSIVDGVEFRPHPSNRPTGKPWRYWLRTDDVAFPSAIAPSLAGFGSQGTWTPIDAKRIIHLFEPARPGMFRELPILTPVMNDLHDLDDLQRLEMLAARNNADIANVITNKTGEANTSASRRQRWQIQSQDKDGNPTNKQAPLWYEVTMGGRTVFVQNGEKFEQFRSDRPSVATKDYWDYMVRKICAGIGISSLLIMPFSLQGTVTRADLDTAAAFFRARSAVFAAAIREIYIWVMGWAVAYDRALDGAPDNWWHVTIRPPKAVNVDTGRQSQAVLEELEAGTRTYQDVCAELGHDWRHVLRQKAVEAKFINDLADEFDVTREQIAQLAKQTMSIKETLAPPSGKALEELEPGAEDDTDDKSKGQAAAQQPLIVNIENKMPTARRRTLKVKDAHGQEREFVLEEQP